MGTYSEGLRHGWVDARNAVREILEQDLPDAEKLAQLERWAVPMKELAEQAAEES